MSQDMLTKSVNILSILDGMDEIDRVTTLAMIAARYHLGAPAGQRVSVKKPAGKGGGETRSSSVTKIEKGVPSETNFLTEVGLSLAPLLRTLPSVSRQQGSEKPHMDLKSVQRRLNRKRAELQAELSHLMDEPEEAYYAFRSLNAIQSFRIAAKDAKATKGCRLPTNPIPEGFGTVVGVLEALSNSLKGEGKVSSNGFFTDEDHQFRLPEFSREEETGDPSQPVLSEDISW